MSVKKFILLGYPQKGYNNKGFSDFLKNDILDSQCQIIKPLFERKTLNSILIANEVVDE